MNAHRRNSKSSDRTSFRLLAHTARWLGFLGPAAAGMLASSFLSAQDAKAAVSMAAKAAASMAANAAEAYQIPVRINRSFFEKTYQQFVRVEINGTPLDYSGQGTWKEHPTQLPAPAPDASTGPVLADFRDFKACSSSDGAPGVQVCFNVMPDVSSVGLNAKEMKLEGLSQVVPSECSEAVSQLAFKGASRSAGDSSGSPSTGLENYRAEFTHDHAAGVPCSLKVTVIFQI